VAGGFVQRSSHRWSDDVAIPSAKGQQVQLTVNIWYDAGTKRVHLTSNDPDLPPEGLHTNLRPGTQADRSARALLARYGKLPEDLPAM
jgi:hypothetical protein